MKAKITAWLNDGERKYTEGVELFEQCAPSNLRGKYLAFFQEGNGSVLSTQYPMLINQLVHIMQNGLIAGEEISDEDEKNVVKIPFNAKAEVKGPSLKKINPDALPAALKEVYARIQEITPQIAALHAQLADENLLEPDAKALVDQTVELDDERNACWDQLDEWAEGKVKEVEEPVVTSRVVLSENALVQGLQIAKRMNQIKQNISRLENTIASAKSATVKANAENKVADYTAEYAELEAKINADPTDVVNDAE